jgi:ABC-type glycerol-3-phosphate transport system substrate-binding protein
MIEEGQLLLFNKDVNYLNDDQFNRALFGEPVTYVGYPSENGNGSLFISDMLVAISNKCTEKEAAWKFLSSMLSEEAQAQSRNAFGPRFPILKSALEKQIEEAMATTYDINGKEVSKSLYSLGSFEIDMYASTKEEIDIILDLIAKTEKFFVFDRQIWNIIRDEAVGFFSGSKTAAETADIVENRIRVYVNETN